MPIYEYSCRACGHAFEALVRRAESPVCAQCGSEEIERVLSLPSVRSESTHGQAMRAARDRDRTIAKDRAHEQLKYERSHDD